MQADRRARLVWERLVQAYGSRVAESFGPTIPQPWAEAVDDLTDEQIKFGLRHVVRDSPIHPPSLGQFIKACMDLPIARSDKGPSLQEQLAAYASLLIHGKEPIRDPDRAKQFMLPWTYLYRQWTDSEKPKPIQNCAECVGVMIPAVGEQPEIRIMVIDMLANSMLHQKALRSFEPGPPPRRTLDASNVLPRIPA